MDVSEVALRAQVAWLRGLAAAGFAQISAGNGFAVSTGLDSNTENGAVIDPSARHLDVLLDWLRERARPASVLVTGPLEPEVTARLIDRGLQPERTGNNMGRPLAGFGKSGTTEKCACARTCGRRQVGHCPDPGWAVSEVTDVAALRENQRVYADDGWWDSAGELDHRVEVAARLGFGPGRPIRHWTAHHEGAPAGAATSFQFEDAALLVHCCVAEGWRRRGIGTALTRISLAAAAHQGAVQAVVFPSPDGYHLHHSLGFELAPVHLDRCFYLP
ncbi:GNAT family N-acetyltransferase [Actinoplanes sp. NPDC049596]|uniref:GNAT family N-acetyltransferase n=1 Tax=unclassified Actinoplanes TaxID=2626549 RepID=UPI00343C69F3